MNRCAETVLGGYEGCGELVASVPSIANGQPLSLAPNPTQGPLTISLDEPALLSLFDARGGLVWQRNVPAGSVQLRSDDLVPGVYLLRSEGRSVRSARFVKE
jgi:hypothetical protein